MGDFVDLLKKLLVMEHSMTEQAAADLVKAKPDVVMQGMLRGNGALRATALALQMRAPNSSEPKP